MKTLIALITLGFFVTACCAQKPDDTFQKEVTFLQGFNTTIIKFSDGSSMAKAPLGVNVTWLTLPGKPLTFPADVHNHDLDYKPLDYVPDWTEITNKPETIGLKQALNELQSIFEILTTAQINALPLIKGKVVIDGDLGVLKFCDGTVWKTLITDK